MKKPMVDEISQQQSQTSLRRKFMIWGALVLLSFLAMAFGEWLVFEALTIPLVLISTRGWSIYLLVVLVTGYLRRPIFIFATLPLVWIVFLGCFVLFLWLFTTPKSCRLTGLTTVMCHNAPIISGDSTELEPQPECWTQQHIAGIFLVGEKSESACNGEGR